MALSKEFWNFLDAAEKEEQARGGIRSGASAQLRNSAQTKAVVRNPAADRMLRRIGLPTGYESPVDKSDVAPFRRDVQALGEQAQEMALPSQYQNIRSKYTKLQETGAQLEAYGNAQDQGTKMDIFRGNYALGGIGDVLDANKDMAQYTRDLDYILNNTNTYDQFRQYLDASKKMGDTQLTKDVLRYGMEMEAPVDQKLLDTQKELEEQQMSIEEQIQANEVLLDALYAKDEWMDNDRRLKETIESKNRELVEQQEAGVVQQQKDVEEEIAKQPKTYFEATKEHNREKAAQYAVWAQGDWDTAGTALEGDKDAEELSKALTQNAGRQMTAQEEYDKLRMKESWTESDRARMTQLEAEMRQNVAEEDAMYKEADSRAQEAEEEADNLYHVIYGDPDWGEYIGSALKSGATGFAAGMYKGVDFVLGRPISYIGSLVTGDQNYKSGITRMSDWYSQKVNNPVQAEAEAAASAMGESGAWRIGQQVISGVVENIPNTVMAVLSGGATAAGGLAAQQSAAVAQMAQQGMSKAAVVAQSIIKDPQYWTSFLRESGGAYEEARNAGAGEITASVYAMLSSLLNSAIEIGPDGKSGIQGIGWVDEDSIFSRAVRAVAGKDVKVLSDILDSGADEAVEELKQGIVSALTAKMTYGKDKKLIGGEGALFNIPQTLESMLVGGLTGGLLAGGNAAVNATADAVGAPVRARTQETMEQGSQIMSNDWMQALAKIAESEGGISDRTTRMILSGKGKENMAAAVGKLYKKTMKKVSQGTQQMIKETLEKPLQGALKGKVQQEDATVRAVLKAFGDEELTESEAALVRQPAAMEALRDLAGAQDVAGSAETADREEAETGEKAAQSENSAGETQKKWTDGISLDNIRTMKDAKLSLAMMPHTKRVTMDDAENATRADMGQEAAKKLSVSESGQTRATVNGKKMYAEIVGVEHKDGITKAKIHTADGNMTVPVENVEFADQQTAERVMVASAVGGEEMANTIFNAKVPTNVDFKTYAKQFATAVAMAKEGATEAEIRSNETTKDLHDAEIRTATKVAEKEMAAQQQEAAKAESAQRSVELSGEETALEFGRMGRSRAELLDVLRDAGIDATSEVYTAYTRGETQRRRAEQARVQEIRELNQGGKTKQRNGVVRSISKAEAEHLGVNEITRKLSDKQKAAVKALRGVAQSMGLNITLFDSVSVTGEQSRLQGQYDRATGTVYLDINAGKGNEQAILRTAAHEITHVIQDWSPEKYGQLKKYLLDYYYNTDNTLVQDLVVEQMQKAPTLTEAQALDEVVADACEMMLSDAEAIKRLAQKDQSIFARIRKWIDDFVSAIRTAMQGVDVSSEEAKILLQTKETMEKAQEMWMSALEDAGSNLRGEAKTVVGEGQTEESAYWRADAEKKLNNAGEAYTVYEERTDDAQSKTKPSAGKSGTAYTADQKEIKYHYELVNASDLVASNTTNMEVNAAYPQQLQPRDRTRQASRDQVWDMARKLNPARLGESVDVQSGAPIIGADRVVESGNGRVLALQIAMKWERKSADKYTKWLKEHAGEFGFDASDVGADSVLVRVRDSQVNREQFVKQANESTVAAYSESETAESDAEKLTPEMMELFIPSETGRIDTAENWGFISRFMDRVIPKNERASYVQKDGTVSQLGWERLRNAIFQKAYGSAQLTNALAEETSEGVKTVLRAMTNAAPHAVLMQEMVQRKQVYDVHLQDAMTEAARRYMQLKRSGTDVNMYLQQETMPGMQTESSGARALMRMFEENKRSVARLTNGILMVMDVLEEYGDPQQVSMFGERSAPEIENLVAQAQSRMDADSVQNSLRPDVPLSADQIESNRTSVAQMNEVAQLAGDEFAIGDGKIKANVLNYWQKKYKGKVLNDVIGEISLDKKGLKASIGHGMTKEKAAAYHAVPDILSEGKVVDYQKSWKGRQLDGVMIAAPVMISGERYLAGVIVVRPHHTDLQRYYTHDVVIEKEGTASDGWRGTTTADRMAYLPMASILQEMRNVKDEKTGNAIKFSLRDEGYQSNRQLLANALEGLAQNANEAQMLQEYKDIAAKLDADAQRVREINVQIREMRLENPGSAEEAELLEERRGLERGITSADRRLFQMESLEPLQRVAQQMRRDAERSLERARRHMERYRQGVIRREHQGRIEREAKRLSKWLTQPNNRRLVPESLRGPLAQFLLSIDMRSYTELTTGEQTKKDREYVRTLDALTNILRNVQQTQDGDTEAEIQELYSGYIDLPRNFVETLTQLVGRAKTQMQEGTFTLQTMSNEELEALDESVSALSRSLTSINELLTEGSTGTVSDTAQASINYMQGMKERAPSYAFASKLGDYLNWENATPLYAFERYGEGGKKIFRSLQEGQSKLAFNTKQVMEAMKEDDYTAKEAREWGEDVKEIEMPDGSTMRIPVTHIMSLYCLAKREQAQGHIYGGGVLVNNYTIKGKTYTDNGHLMSPEMVDRITGMLTEKQRKVADKMQHIMNTLGSEWGNYVSVRRFGYRMFTERNYFPIEVDENRKGARTDDSKGNELYRLLNMSMTKQLTTKASNRLVLKNIFDVYSKHMADMAQYNALALPSLDAVKWLNWQENEMNEEGQISTQSLRDAARYAYGDVANKYIVDLLKDVNGVRAMAEGDDKFATKAISRYNRVAVAANLRVALLQPLSIVRAGMELPGTSIAKGVVKIKNTNKNVKEMMEHSGIAIWKDIGGPEMNVSRSVTEQIKRTDSTMDKIVEASMKGAELMDKVTWAAIWQSCKEYVNKHTAQPIGSKEYFTEVARKFEDVIYRTQVVDSVLTKSKYMRAGTPMKRMLSAFMSEPTTSYNMLLNAYTKMKANMRRGDSFQQAWQKSGKLVMKTAAVYTMSALLQTVVEQIMTAYRDDDDYETFVDKAMDGAVETLVDNVLPTSLVPIFSQMTDIAKTTIGTVTGSGVSGFDQQNLVFAGYETLNDGIELMTKWVNGELSGYTPYGAVYKTLSGLSSVTGLPVAPAMREVVALVNNTYGYITGKRIQTYQTSKTAGYAALYNAYDRGNDERAAELYDELLANRISEKKIRSGLTTQAKNAYLSNDMSAEEAIAFLVKHGGITEDKAYFKLQEWGYENENEDDYSIYSALEEAVKTGMGIEAAAKELTDHGYSQSQVQSKVREVVKEAYLDGEMTRAQAESMLKKNGGLDDNGAYFKMLQYDYEEKTGDSTSSDACMIFYAIDNQQSPKSAIDDAMKHGKTKSGLASSITSRYKEEYLKLAKTDMKAAAALKGRLITTFDYLGYKGKEKVEGW